VPREDLTLNQRSISAAQDVRVICGAAAMKTVLLHSGLKSRDRSGFPTGLPCLFPARIDIIGDSNWVGAFFEIPVIGQSRHERQNDNENRRPRSYVEILVPSDDRSEYWEPCSEVAREKQHTTWLTSSESFQLNASAPSHPSSSCGLTSLRPSRLVNRSVRNICGHAAHLL